MIISTSLEDIKKNLDTGETCVINLTAKWCSDCTDQAKNMTVFSDALQKQQIDCYTLSVQSEKNVYLSPEHQDFTELLGGHGFPRTVLVINGEIVDADNVEIISEAQLKALSKVFLAQL
ncbi:redoxin domain-containing protein [Psychromonas sp. KJ10-10]|uniref:redoxin domain-containing protein n=1 Tax=Psychromonas sp. KJ10-10 TaxID=3391823 RepID=UPI0039B64DA2